MVFTHLEDGSTALFIFESRGDAVFASPPPAELNGVVLGGLGLSLLPSLLRVQHLTRDAVEHVFHVFVLLRRSFEHSDRHLIRETLGVLNEE